METNRRKYFRKIINNLPETNNAIKRSNDENSLETECNKVTENLVKKPFVTSNIVVTMLGSSSYHKQNEKNIYEDTEQEKQIYGQGINSDEDFFRNNDVVKEIQKNNIGNLESVTDENQTIITDSTIIIELEEENGLNDVDIEELKTSHINTEKLKETEKPDLTHIIESNHTMTITETDRSQLQATTIDMQPERKSPENESASDLQPTITQIIAEKDMDLIRKSLEEDNPEAEQMDFVNLPGPSSPAQRDKNKTRLVKKINCYVELVSDNEDFIWDSSSWKDTSDDSASTDGKESKKKKKKKTAIEPEDGKIGSTGLKRSKVNKRKLARDSKENGKKYLKKDGTEVAEKSMQPNPCVGKKCRNNCQEIAEEKRKKLFDHFWSLSSQRKKDWIIAMTTKSDIKRKRNKSSTYRENTYYYYINDGEGRRQVCLKFLLQTLNVSQRFINYTLSNAYFGMSKEDLRGKIVPKNKTPDVVKQSAVNFIKALPALPSHYCRKESTRLYLPVEFKNISNLYRIYKEDHTSKGIDVVGERVFRDIFNNEFNVGFHVPKKDKCMKCLRFEGKDVNECPEMRAHLEEKEASKARLVIHRELPKKNATVMCTSFDLQKVLNTPYGNSMLLFYSRKYTVYNLCFYESVTRNGFCYMWGETEGKRGGVEIATILQKYIASVDLRGTVKCLILYSDSCPGQNKNKIVLAAIHNALLQSQHLETIQMNYLLPGHTEMTVDSIHATIENSTRNTIIWAPSQWSTVFQLARKEPGPYHVEALRHTDFKNYDDLADKYFKGNLQGKISKIRVATFKKSSPSVMTIKESMKDDAQTSKVAIVARPKELVSKYKAPLIITTAKYKDLMKLCETGVIPVQYHEEYTNFSHRAGKDTLVDTDVEDDSE